MIPYKEYQKAERGEDHDCDLIASDATYSYWYARYVINGRWLKGENAIAGDAACSFGYARNVINGRWLKGENTIAGDANYSLWYTEDIVKGDFLVKPRKLSSAAAISSAKT